MLAKAKPRFSNCWSMHLHFRPFHRFFGNMYNFEQSVPSLHRHFSVNVATWALGSLGLTQGRSKKYFIALIAQVNYLLLQLKVNSWRFSISCSILSEALHHQSSKLIFAITCSCSEIWPTWLTAVHSKSNWFPHCKHEINFCRYLEANTEWEWQCDEDD